MEMHKPNTLKPKQKTFTRLGYRWLLVCPGLTKRPLLFGELGKLRVTFHCVSAVPSYDSSPGRQGHNGSILSCPRTCNALHSLPSTPFLFANASSFILNVLSLLSLLQFHGSLTSRIRAPAERGPLLCGSRWQ